jgi:hypothetical protein
MRYASLSADGRHRFRQFIMQPSARSGRSAGGQPSLKVGEHRGIGDGLRIHDR